MYFLCQKPWPRPKPGQGQAIWVGFGLAETLRKPGLPKAKPKLGLLGQAGPGRSLIGYQTPERPTWDQEGTQSTFLMMTKYDVRDVGRKDISLGIVTKNIDMMGSNTFQLSGKRIWWNWRMLLTGTTINENTQDFKQDHSGPSQKNYDPPTTANPFLLSSI